MKNNIYYAWYSVQQAAISGVVIYRTADGKEIEATTISSNKDSHGTKWDDIAYVGEVATFDRRLSYGEIGDLALNDEENVSDERWENFLNRIKAASLRVKKNNETDRFRWN